MVNDSIIDEKLTDRALNEAPNRLGSRENLDALHRRIDLHTDADSSLADELRQSLLNSLPFVRAGSEAASDLDFLLAKYGASLAELQTRQEEITAFLDSVLRVNLEVRRCDSGHEEALQELVTRELNQLRDKARMEPLPGDTILAAGATNLPLNVLRDRMREALRSKAEFLVQGFLGVCRRLVEQQTFGVVAWANPSSCSLTFFRKIVCQNNAKSERINGETKSEISEEGIGIRSRTDTIVETGEYEVRNARFEHHLFKANRVLLEKTGSMIPFRFQELVSTIPSWLKPKIDLITGVQFLEQIREVEVRRENTKRVREDIVREEFVPQVYVRDEYQHFAEPAIVLGPVVFTGWGSAEIEEENMRLEEAARLENIQQATDFAISQRNQRLALLAIHTLTSVILVITFAFDVALFWPAIAFAAMGACIAASAVGYDAQARGVSSGASVILQGMATFAAASLCVHLLLIGLVLQLWVIAGIGVLVGGLAFTLVNQVWLARKA